MAAGLRNCCTQAEMQDTCSLSITAGRSSASTFLRADLPVSRSPIVIRHRTWLKCVRSSFGKRKDGETTEVVSRPWRGLCTISRSATLGLTMRC